MSLHFPYLMFLKFLLGAGGGRGGLPGIRGWKMKRGLNSSHNMMGKARPSVFFFGANFHHLVTR